MLYESKINLSVQKDILRVNPQFHGRPRFDCVLIQAHQDDYIFARLLQVFTITYQTRRHSLALVLPFDNRIPLLNRGRDRDLRFTRVISRPRSTCVVIDVETIIRGALIVEDYGADLGNSFIIVDVVDADMWWRMKSVKLAYKVAL